MNGGKIYGQKQTGALFVKTGVQLQPIIVGGGQEKNLRSGTENVAGIIGLAKALDIAQRKQKNESIRLRSLKDDFIRSLGQKIPNAIVNGSVKHSSPHILNISFPGVDGERLMMELDEKGIICATGSACSASNEEPSHVLRAIGLNDQLAGGSLRFSFGRQTTRSDILKTLQTVGSLVRANR
jgi:cysteine desulfurase